MGWLQETLVALMLGLRLNFARPRNLLLVAAGLLIASATLLVVLSIPAGLERVAAHTGRDDVVVVLATNHGGDSDGAISQEMVERISALPGVAHREDGSPLTAPQFVVHAKLPQRNGGSATVVLRGITSATFDVAGDSLHLIDGKPFAEGTAELVSGEAAANDYILTKVGSHIKLQHSMWQVTGEFAANGSLWESELWADMSTLQAVFNAQGQTTTVWVRLTTPAAFTTFASAMQADPRLRGYPVLTQHDFYLGHVAYLATFVRLAAWIIAIVLGVMAILASQNAVSLALRARRRELATLRATGFVNSALFAALLIETLLIAALCAGVAIGLGKLLIDARDIESSTVSASIRFATAVTPLVMFATLGYAMLLGMLSALGPAWSALQAHLAKSLTRE